MRYDIHMTRNDLVQVRVSRREHRWWAAAADQAELTVSELVRAAVRHQIAVLFREPQDPRALVRAEKAAAARRCAQSAAAGGNVPPGSPVEGVCS